MTPFVLTVAVAAVGAAFLTDAGSLLILEWRSAAILVVAFAGAALLVVSTPRWWRLISLVPFVAVVVIPVTLWNPIPDPGLSPLRRYVPLIVPQDEAQPPEGISLALLRVRLVPGSDSLEIAMLPTTPLLTAHTESPGGALPGTAVAPLGTEDILARRPGVWPVIATIPLDAVVRITVETVRNPAALWWFPPSGLPLTITVDVDDDTEPSSRTTRSDLRRYLPGNARTSLFTYLSTTGLMHVDQEVVQFPRGGDGFLQPGLYLIGLAPDGLIVPGEFADSQ